MEATLCSPGQGLSCFRCCPPIRPPGYDHLTFRSSLQNEFSRNRADYLAGRLPQAEHAGFFCSGLGFLDARGSRVGCLFHPANNRGEDLRHATGYRDKCARESCPQFRAFALLEPEAGQALLALCRGMDPFVFSSLGKNPVMRLLALGPETAAAAAGQEPDTAADLARMPLLSLAPHHGWLAGKLLAASGAGLAASERLPVLLDELSKNLRRLAGPALPMERGERLHEMAGEWESRFWKKQTGRQRALPRELAAWRRDLARLLADIGQ